MRSLSVIVPTYNEAENIGPLVERLHSALAGVDYELIIVDDSTDGTANVLADAARSTPQLRVIHRDGQRGLASAVADGIAAARGDVLCVLDADLQHPPETLPTLLEALDRTGSDLVIASRYAPGGRYETFSAARRFVSRIATTLARVLLSRARSVSDPVSGFFAFRRRVIEGKTLRPVGYKILLEVLVRGDISRVVEVPYRFEARNAGQSKLTSSQHAEYLKHLLRLAPVNPDDLRFVRFGLVGLSGILVNTVVLWLLKTRMGLYYVTAGALAIVVAITWNFLLNDTFTWRERRSRTARDMGTRYLKYWTVSGVGSLLQVGGLYIFTEAGLPYLVSNLIGIVLGVVWNFKMHSGWTWKPTEPPLRRTVYTPGSSQNAKGDADLSGAVEGPGARASS